MYKTHMWSPVTIYTSMYKTCCTIYIRDAIVGLETLHPVHIIPEVTLFCSGWGVDYPISDIIYRKDNFQAQY